ncbi:MAG TPA: leucyl aminopeptidase [Acidimicrobiia bacterium]|nr:leucyl aminopeptidase [Acidimicrobiia bacterium]
MAPFTGRKTFDPVPYVDVLANLDVDVSREAPDGRTIGVLVRPGAKLPEAAPLDWDGLNSVGFEGEKGQTVPLPVGMGSRLILVGVGDSGLTANTLRDAAAAFSRATLHNAEVGFTLPDDFDPALAAQVVVEGILLARYRYDALKSKVSVPPVTSITLVSSDTDQVTAGARRGVALAEATAIARDLANTPPALLTATQMADVAKRLGVDRGLQVEVFGKDELVDMECGGMLGVNAGSTEPPQLIKLTYDPDGETKATLSMVGKGIMYDAGGLALKPADPVHAAMKNDMSGAGAILGAMMNLGRLGCENRVIGYLCCTDNRPSGSAIAMGDVLTIRGGTTVEVANTDAEGRLVMADGLVLATEEPTDAIVDIATLTGAAMRALGTEIAQVMGNDDGLVEQIRAASETTDEPVWPMPLAHRYRKQLDSTVADMKNLGGANAGSITAGLFLEEFVDGKPWAHIDIAGVADNETDASWRPPGCTGFGARLLAEFAIDFEPTGN